MRAQDESYAALTATLEGIVQAQAADWNRGDIEGFMRAYWKSDRLTFSSGGQVQRGWNATRDRYLQRNPTPQSMGRLVTKLFADSR